MEAEGCQREFGFGASGKTYIFKKKHLVKCGTSLRPQNMGAEAADLELEASLGYIRMSSWPTLAI